MLHQDKGDTRKPQVPETWPDRLWGRVLTRLNLCELISMTAECTLKPQNASAAVACVLTGSLMNSAGSRHGIDCHRHTGIVHCAKPKLLALILDKAVTRMKLNLEGSALAADMLQNWLCCTELAQNWLVHLLDEGAAASSPALA